jgi:sugar-specific transcriptional regulator TrmB
MIEDSLKKLGLSDKETAVYLCVLKNGKITPAAVSRITGINRTTVYSVAKDLAEKRFIAQDLGSSNNFLVALPPEELASKKTAIDKTIAELKDYTKDKAYPLPKITFIAEESLEDYLYNQIYKWYESMQKSDFTWWGFQDHTLVEHYQKWIDWQWREAVPPKIQLKLLSNQSEVELKMKQKQYQQRQIKFWPGQHQFTATTWVMGDYIVLVATKEKPFYLVETHDALLANNMRELFKGVWQGIAS